VAYAMNLCAGTANTGQRTRSITANLLVKSLISTCTQSRGWPRENVNDMDSGEKDETLTDSIGRDRDQTQEFSRY